MPIERLGTRGGASGEQLTNDGQVRDYGQRN